MKPKFIPIIVGMLLCTSVLHAQTSNKTTVQELVNTVCHQGSVKLTAEQETQLVDWLKINGESIKDVHPSVFKDEVLNEAQGRFQNTNPAPPPASPASGKDGYTWHDVRFVESKDALYVFMMDVPQGDMRIKALHTAVGGRIIGSVKLLGSAERMSWEQEERELNLEKPHTLPKDGVVVFKITWIEYYQEKPRDPSIKILQP